MTSLTFFTALDDRAKIKGSRDPLGMQGIWTRLGRDVVGNLTTVSNSLRDFVVLLAGLHLADPRNDDGGSGADLATFLRWEQLCAYARAQYNADREFRGVDRVRQRLGQPLVLSHTRPILSDQKTYGLWGLYTAPARASGLVHNNANSLAAGARAFVEESYLTRLDRKRGTLQKLRRVLSKPEHRLQSAEDVALLEVAAELIKCTALSGRDKAFYRHHFVEGGPTDVTQGRQARLAHQLLKDSSPFSQTAEGLHALIARAKAAGDHDLGDRLDAIRTADAVLLPLGNAFAWLLSADGRAVGDVASDLEAQWGSGLRSLEVTAFSALPGALPEDETLASLWKRAAQDAYAGDFGDLVRVLVDINTSVMAARGGAPWIRVEGGKIKAGTHEGVEALLPPDELKGRMRFPYFIPSLDRVSRSVEVH